MKKIIVMNMVSVDGYFTSRNGSIDWHNVDEDYNKFAIELLKTVDTLLLGHITYDLFESYWPAALNDPKTSKSDLIIAKAIDKATKVVISDYKEKLTWNNSVHLKTINRKEIEALKNQPGKNIVIYGSGTVTRQLLQLHLIDELQLMVNPIILGEGRPLFEDEHKLELINSRSFKSGNVLLNYSVA